MRALVWEGCRNVRDLGGLPTEDGGETRFGAIVRSDNLRRLSESGWQALLDYGIRTAVDLRRPDELALDPPGAAPIEVIQLDLCPLDLIGAELALELEDAYLDILETFHGNFARAITAVARAPEGGVVVHCLVGRDRTGLVAALLLRLAGVEASAVAADWAESEANLAADLRAWVAAATDPRERRRREAFVDGASEAAMERVLAELDRRYGSAAEYLLAGGAEGAELELARARLRW
ncbi:MAG TPA: tyrosine-protein phosphatase [Gaiellaceae bacterium]|nr:tyrosine-protein phosphatase [Gaiellaceae bacterium]